MLRHSHEFLDDPQTSSSSSAVLWLRRRASSAESTNTSSAVIALWRNFKDLFNTRTVQIQSDNIGYGFVLRGEGPSYVQTVDPSGPAAEAGLRVGHIVENVNGLDVMRMNHKDVGRIILGHESTVVTMKVLEPADFKD